MWISQKRYYLTADRSKAVEEGDLHAAFLLVGEGGSLPEADARRYGLLKDEPEPVEPAVENQVTQSLADEPPEPEAKAVHYPPANKAIGGPAEDKAARAPAPDVTKRSRKRR